MKRIAVESILYCFNFQLYSSYKQANIMQTGILKKQPHTVRQTDMHPHKQTDRMTDWQTDRRLCKQTDGQTERMTGE